MALRKRTIRKMSPVARKLARLINEFQSTARRLKYLLSDIQDLEYAVTAFTLERKEVVDVQPEDTGGSHTEDLSRRKKRQSRDDQVGKPGNRRGSAAGVGRNRPRNKRKKFEKGAKAS
jgi:hypothetical protein